MEMTMLYVAGGAMMLAIVMWLAKRGKSKNSQTTHASPPAMGVMGVPSVKPKGPPPPMPSARKAQNRRYRNRKGWTAPSGHYFNDADELFTDAGDLIVDMLIIANLCGIDDYVKEVAEVDESVSTETIASGSEVGPSSDFSDLHTAPSTSVSVPEPAPAQSYYGGGSGGDSGGYDSGGGCDSGGDD